MRHSHLDIHLHFEGSPLPSKFFSGPHTPMLIDQLDPGDVIFVLEIQVRDPMCG
jgi:hypothetical protein